MATATEGFHSGIAAFERSAANWVDERDGHVEVRSNDGNLPVMPAEQLKSLRQGNGDLVPEVNQWSSNGDVRVAAQFQNMRSDAEDAGLDTNPGRIRTSEKDALTPHGVGARMPLKSISIMDKLRVEKLQWQLEEERRQMRALRDELHRAKEEFREKRQKPASKGKPDLDKELALVREELEQTRAELRQSQQHRHGENTSDIHGLRHLVLTNNPLDDSISSVSLVPVLRQPQQLRRGNGGEDTSDGHGLKQPVLTNNPPDDGIPSANLMPVRRWTPRGLVVAEMDTTKSGGSKGSSSWGTQSQPLSRLRWSREAAEKDVAKRNWSNGGAVDTRSQPMSRWRSPNSTSESTLQTTSGVPIPDNPLSATSTSSGKGAAGEILIRGGSSSLADTFAFTASAGNEHIAVDTKSGFGLKQGLARKEDSEPVKEAGDEISNTAVREKLLMQGAVPPVSSASAESSSFSLQRGMSRNEVDTMSKDAEDEVSIKPTMVNTLTERSSSLQSKSSSFSLPRGMSRKEVDTMSKDADDEVNSKPTRVNTLTERSSSLQSKSSSFTKEGLASTETSSSGAAVTSAISKLRSMTARLRNPAA